MIAAELKTAKGRVTPEQRDVLRSLGAAGVEVYVWRPADFPQVHAILAGKA